MWWCSGEVPVAATIVPVLLAGGHRHYYRGTITVLHSIFVYECWYNIRNHAWYSPGMYGTSDSRRVKRANIFQRTFTLNFSSEYSHFPANYQHTAHRITSGVLILTHQNDYHYTLVFGFCSVRFSSVDIICIYIIL